MQPLVDTFPSSLGGVQLQEVISLLRKRGTNYDFS